MRDDEIWAVLLPFFKNLYRLTLKGKHVVGRDDLDVRKRVEERDRVGTRRLQRIVCPVYLAEREVSDFEFGVHG